MSPGVMLGGVVLGVACALGGCGRERPTMGGGPGRVLGGGALEKEAWWQRVPMERAEEFGEAARVEWWGVRAEKVGEAVGRLEKRPWCVLTRDEAAEFVGER